MRNCPIGSSLASVLVALWLLVYPSGGEAASSSARVVEDFEHGLGEGWEVKSFQGETDYEIVPAEKGHALQARSRAAASALLHPISYSLKDYPFLSWRWRVDHVLDRGDATRKEGDDYAARVYVIFPHWYPPHTRSINYIWANRLPKGGTLPNSYYSRAVMVAVQSGNAEAGRWVREERNVLEDYRRIFGEDPPQVGAIALMTDTDNTGESALAWYDDLEISAKPGETVSR